MFRHRSIFLLAAALAALLSGCGGGKGTSDNLVTLRTGSTWVYSLAGTVTLSAAQGGIPGGSTQNLQSTSTYTMQVISGTVNDANKQPTNILDRVFDLKLLDGREIKAHFRLYYTQSNLGIFVHGINDYVGDTASASNDKFAPAAANPPYQFLYLPNPLSDGTNLSYVNPLDLFTTANESYTLAVGTGRQPVTTPAGTFLAKAVQITENFDNFALTNTGIVPNIGIVVGTVTATLPDGSQVTGTITLQSVNL